MLFAPFGLGVWLLGLLSLAMLGGGGYLLWAWWVGAVVGTVYLLGSLAMLVMSFFGRFIVMALFRRGGEDEPRFARWGALEPVTAPDGTRLHVERYGLADGPTLVFTHGWGMDGREWYYAKKQLADRFRLIVWDLPGLGGSSRPPDDEYALERLASHLEAVTASVGGPVVLVGHSIGGMIIQTFCRLYPQQLGSRVVGLVLANTTHTNPARTVILAPLARALQKPLVEPLMHLMVWLSPLVWLMNWLSYQNGTSHVLSMATGFGGHETRGQLDFTTRFTAMASPAVLARGVLAMLNTFEETATLPKIAVPTLVVTGDVDRTTVPQAGETIASAVPGAELRTLDPAGHMAPVELNDQFDAIVADFAARCFSRGRADLTDRLTA